MLAEEVASLFVGQEVASLLVAMAKDDAAAAACFFPIAAGATVHVSSAHLSADATVLCTSQWLRETEGGKVILAAAAASAAAAAATVAAAPGDAEADSSSAAADADADATAHAEADGAAPAAAFIIRTPLPTISPPPPSESLIKSSSESANECYVVALTSEVTTLPMSRTAKPKRAGGSAAEATSPPSDPSTHAHFALVLRQHLSVPLKPELVVCRMLDAQYADAAFFLPSVPEWHSRALERIAKQASVAGTLDGQRCGSCGASRPDDLSASATRASSSAAAAARWSAPALPTLPTKRATTATTSSHHA